MSTPMLIVLLLVASACSEDIRRRGRMDRVWKNLGAPPSSFKKEEGPSQQLLDYPVKFPGKSQESTEILQAVKEILSSVCCNPGTFFNPVAKTCETSGLRSRGFITVLPPNCPRGTKFDSINSICRDDCQDGYQYDPDSKMCRDNWGFRIARETASQSQPMADFGEEDKTQEVTSKTLALMCCPKGAIFNSVSKKCVFGRRKLRGMITILPPNCPPPSKFDEASKTCRTPFFFQ